MHPSYRLSQSLYRRAIESVTSLYFGYVEKLFCRHTAEYWKTNSPCWKRCGKHFEKVLLCEVDDIKTNEKMGRECDNGCSVILLLDTWKIVLKYFRSILHNVIVLCRHYMNSVDIWWSSIVFNQWNIAPHCKVHQEIIALQGIVEME